MNTDSPTSRKERERVKKIKPEIPFTVKIALQFALSSHRPLTSLPDSIQKRDSWQSRFISGVLTSADSGAIVRVYTSLLQNFVRGFIFLLLFFYCVSLLLDSLFRNVLVVEGAGAFINGLLTFKKAMRILQRKVSVAYIHIFRGQTLTRTPC